jgi:hypothetical protein
MTPKEKAEKLLKKMLGKNPNRQDGISRIDVIQAKQCALIAVDEILNEIPEFFKDSIQTFKGDIKIDVPNCSYDFWKQVKHEIQKL